MSRPGVRYPVRRIFLVDVLAVVAAFFLALIIRYKSSFRYWTEIYDGLYVSLLVVVCLLAALIFLVYDARRKHIFHQDPFENLVSVIKGRILLIAFSLLYLYATQKGEQSSRLVIAIFFVLSVVTGYIFRMAYRSIYLKKNPVTDEWKTLELYAPYPEEKELLRMFRDGDCRDVLIHTGKTGINAAGIESAESEKYDARRISDICEKAGIRAYLDLSLDGYRIKNGLVTDVAEFTAVPAFVRAERFDLFGIKYAQARTEEAVLHVIRHIRELSGQYICFSNVHTSVMGKENPDYRNVLNGAAYVFPDGNPIAILQQKSGATGTERVAGPDFMDHMFKDTKDGQLSHYFYGSSQETLDALNKRLLEKYPNIDIRGMYSPPFRPLSEEEDREDVRRINESGADIVWIGLGAPKQEKWMNAHKGQINGVMMGVGAGFDFHAGTIKRAPGWIQKIGLEWLYRLFQDPGRLFKRYFVTNGKFIWYLIWGRK